MRMCSRGIPVAIPVLNAWEGARVGVRMSGVRRTVEVEKIGGGSQEGKGRGRALMSIKPKNS